MPAKSYINYGQADVRKTHLSSVIQDGQFKTSPADRRRGIL